MAEIKDLSTTDASNNGTAANAGFPESMPPSDVNNAARALEGMIARLYADTNGTVATTGSAGAYLLAPNQTVSAYTDGDIYVIEANHTNVGSATIDVSSVGVKSIVTQEGNALAGGEIVSGGRYILNYDGTNFQLIGGANPNTLLSGGSIRAQANTQGVAITGANTGNVITTITSESTNDPVLTLTGATFGARLYVDQDGATTYLRQTAADGTTLEDVHIGANRNGGVEIYADGTLRAATTTLGLDAYGTVMELDNSSAATPTFLKARNSEGGLSIATDGGNVTIYQTDSAGSAQDSWIAMSQNGGVAMYYDNAARVTSTSAGATVAGTLNATTALTAGGVAALLAGGELNDLANADKTMAASPGYYTLPGGLTLQWGLTGGTASSTTLSDTFDQTFTTLYGAVAFPKGTSSPDLNYVLSASSTTGLSINVVHGGGGVSVSFFWIALGYIAP